MDKEHLFLAVLIYKIDTNWKCESKHIFSVTHPEIAYQVALSIGQEQRYGRQFLGLAKLEEVTTYSDTGTTMQVLKEGETFPTVFSKAELAAFQMDKWKNIPCNQVALREALAEPTYLIDLEGIDDLPWYKWKHAYGEADDVPRDLKRLVSTNSEDREQALWELLGSIYHQGTLYDATQYAIPFIVQILENRTLPDRDKIMALLYAITQSAVIDPAIIRKAWVKRKTFSWSNVSKSTEEKAEREIQNYQNAKKVLLNNLSTIQNLTFDDNPDIVNRATQIVQWLL